MLLPGVIIATISVVGPALAGLAVKMALNAPFTALVATLINNRLWKRKAVTVMRHGKALYLTL